MTWNSLETLRDARGRVLSTDGTLFGAAWNSMEQKAAGSIKESEAVDNDTFLETLVREHRISEERRQECIKAIEAFKEVQVDPTELKRALYYSSLPETYVHEDIARLLTRTRQLLDVNTIKSRTKGTSETIQSVIVGLTDTDMEGLFIAFKDLGLRHRMLDRTHSHAGKHLINQVSMAYTLLTFSFTPLVAMRRANEQAPAEDKTLSEENREIWLRMWNIVGSLMGIEEGGLPPTLEEAGRLLDLIRTSQGYKHTSEGHELLRALMNRKDIEKQKRFALYAGDDLLAFLGFPK